MLKSASSALTTPRKTIDGDGVVNVKMRRQWMETRGIINRVNLIAQPEGRVHRRRAGNCRSTK
jgi:hypothetical protein